MNTTQKLKAELWKRFGSPETPAEWDGHIFGGGKLSQRYWEYFKAIELLDLTPSSVVIDLGGGSPTDGVGFFASLISTAVKKIIIFDSSIPPHATPPPNVEFHRMDASYEKLSHLLRERPDITHIACISVFEHIESSLRQGIVRAIDESFHGTSFVTTFEFHALRTYFEHQLNARTLSALFSPLKRFYPDEFSASPVWCENAYDQHRTVKLKPTSYTTLDTPFWYPVAIRFLPLPA